MEVVKRINPRTEQLASEYQLGKVIAEYREHWLKNGLALSALLLPGLAALALAIPLLRSPSGDWLSRLERISNLLPLLTWGGCYSLLGVISAILVVMGLWTGEGRVSLCEKGFISAHRRVEVIARWETIQAIRRHGLFLAEKSDSTQHCTYHIIPAEGKRCAIADEPGPAIEQAVTAALLPRTLQDYDARRLITFEKLSLNHQGIYLQDKTASWKLLPALALLGIAKQRQKPHGTSGERFLPWSELAMFWVDERRSTLVISKKGERKHWAVLPLIQVPNIVLCSALVQHALQKSIPEAI